MSLRRQQFINFLNSQRSSAQRVAVVAAVEGVQQRAILTDQSRFGGGGASINTQIAVSGIGG